MKTKLKLLIVFLFAIFIHEKIYSQYFYNLNIPDVFNNHGCGSWCWAHITVDIVNYYGEFFPSTLDVVDLARVKHNITPDPPVTSCYTNPLACCISDGAPPLIGSYGIMLKGISNPLTSEQLVQEFCYHQPVVIYVIGHVFIAEGLSGYDLVNVLDGGYGRMIRPINDIYPNKPWLRSEVMKHSPNWAYHNDVSDRYTNSRTFKATNFISVKAEFANSASLPIAYFSFCTNGSVYLNSGFNVSTNCVINIYTNNSNCQ